MALFRIGSVSTSISRRTFVLSFGWQIALILVPVILSGLAASAAAAAAAAAALGEDCDCDYDCLDLDTATDEKCQSPFGSTHQPQATKASVNLQDYLQHNLSATLHWDDIQATLERGELVVIPNAFPHDFAVQVYNELNTVPPEEWVLYQGSFDTGFAFYHHNLRHPTHYPHVNQSLTIFYSPATRDFIAQLSGRDCHGASQDGTASHYHVLDYSMPHNDHLHARTVAYVWHLATPGWKPEWGGALYYLPQHHHGQGVRQQQHDGESAYYHASFNTLFLFSVTTQSYHLVTPVNRNVPLHHKRLAVNGWWSSAWQPTPDNWKEWLDVLATPQQRRKLSDQQWRTMEGLLLLHNKEQGIILPDLDAANQHQLEHLLDLFHYENYNANSPRNPRQQAQMMQSSQQQQQQATQSSLNELSRRE